MERGVAKSRGSNLMADMSGKPGNLETNLVSILIIQEVNSINDKNVMSINI